MARNALLEKMLDRVYAAMSAGPALNCRPHASRQRIDLAHLCRLDGGPSARFLGQVLGEGGTCKVLALRPSAPAELEPEQKEAFIEEREELQRKVLSRLRTIAEEARSFEQETGAQVLFIGYPLLQLPVRKGRSGGETKRLLAPIAFVPVTLSVKTGNTPSVELSSAGEGADRVIPNPALLAWMTQQTGVRFNPQSADESSAPPWEELAALTAQACKALELEVPPPLKPEAELEAIAKTVDEEAKNARIVPGAVLGLFPLGNQNLVDDLEAMADGESLVGPVESFLRSGLGLVHPRAPNGEVRPAVARTEVGAEHLVTDADPCQARAVRLARSAQGLVVHGPPGTGKSQTIANVIGDHLARGERVLFVCDKRTALDVVLHRLNHLGLGGLCAIVHDARKDQRDLYMGDPRAARRSRRGEGRVGPCGRSGGGGCRAGAGPRRGGWVHGPARRAERGRALLSGAHGTVGSASGPGGLRPATGADTWVGPQQSREAGLRPEGALRPGHPDRLHPQPLARPPGAQADRLRRPPPRPLASGRRGGRRRRPERRCHPE